MGAGTDVAIDAADVVLMKSNLTDAAAAIRLSRQTYRDIVENLFWALIYNVLLIPLAAGAYAHWGLSMSPMWGAAAMSCSSVFVCLNALRLNLFKVYNTQHDKPKKNALPTGIVLIEAQEKPAPKTQSGAFGRETVHIEGMMCGHCEATVKKALEALPQVDDAVVSHEKGTAEIALNAPVDESVLKDTIEAKDYTFVSVEPEA